jgi:hypothetical protein
VLFESTADTIVAGMALSLTYIKVVQLLQPFKDPQLNLIKETSLWQIFFIFLIAMLIKMDEVDSEFLTMCLLLTFFMNFAMLGWQWVAWKLRQAHSLWSESGSKQAGTTQTDYEMRDVNLGGSIEESPLHLDQERTGC